MDAGAYRTMLGDSQGSAATYVILCAVKHVAAIDETTNVLLHLLGAGAQTLEVFHWCVVAVHPQVP